MPIATPASFTHLDCELCGGESFHPVREWHGVSRIIRCGGCGLQFVNPMPDRGWLDEIYKRSGMQNDESHYYRKYIRERQTRELSFSRLFENRLALIERYRPAKGKIIDLGCGAGFFLAAAKSRGWEPHGVDIVPQFISHAREHLQLDHVHLASAETCELPVDVFDAVTMWDLIEHLQHPAALLKKVFKALRAGGVATLWTPNADNALLLQDEWPGYSPDQHLYFFSRKTLAGLLTQAGFQIVHASTNRAKKGFLRKLDPDHVPAVKPSGGIEKLAFVLRRDLKNLFNPMNYLSPLLDLAGYGFNLLLIARKPES